ncbi:DUF1570 domain-containing protein [Qipengyuania sp. YG27]|uniref:DUF1570 domain-containing protein n=1 Tax=Qipengyuania mesophila TaxID=2867246 RepID=A0ABS7JWB3_9SPHN|nr:DUF1570 domain-containing protein [Qipengyuania mesophila]MBX7501955.1 DUF1570 domain-containing protein [Qipengyuania mesophila]
MLRIFAAVAALSLAVPAQAEWHRADSQHFVIYADDSAKDVARFSEMLERYHAAMAFVTQREVETPSPSNRLTIYAVGSARKMLKLAGSRNVAGFYFARAGGSVAFVPDVRASSGQLDFSMITLLHEYAHHFLIGSSRFAMPRWMDEGGAEFFAPARFPSDGEVQIGRPALHRTYELKNAPDVSIAQLFERGGFRLGDGIPEDNFYGRSWALYHYLTFEPARKGQLLDYARRIAAGEASGVAAKGAFGDLVALDHELDRYVKQRRLKGFVLPPELIPIRPITVVQVSPGMDEMLPVIIRSKRGVDRETALEILEDAREVAARYPGDAGVLAALAEAEYDAGNDDAAIAAADAALAIDATVKNALVQKGFALFRKAEEADDEEAAFAAAMQPFSALNQLEQDHPLPLIYYYRSFVERGAAPNETARHALERAAQLSPFDRRLAMNAGLMQAREGKVAIARSTLGPVAANPHGGRMAREAQRYIDELAEVAEGTEWRPGSMVDLTDVLAAITRKYDEYDEDEGE